MSIRGKVLLIEDNLITQEMVKASLEKDCDLTIANDGAEALKRIQENTFDLLLVDVQLPDVDGFDLFAQIKKLSLVGEPAFVFLTGRGATEDRIRGFSLGADDYIVKPFDLMEFKVRVESKLNRILAKSPARDVIVKGPFQIRVNSQKISVQNPGKELFTLELTSNQFKVFFYLIQNENKVVSRDIILKEIWGEGVHVTGRTIDTHIYSVRQQLGEAAKYLKSVHGKGYCFSLESAKQDAA